MQLLLRPRRSVLYMPGANARALEKARSLAADCLILDLEDAVAPESKAKAREQVVAAIHPGGYGHREVIIRVNSSETAWGKEDLAAIAPLSLDGVLLPKISTPEQIEDAVDFLDAHGSAPTLPIWIMAETPQGILNMATIASSHPRLAVIVMGTSDLAKEMRVRHTPERMGLVTPLSLSVLAARANGLDIIDGVYLNLEDETGFRSACIQGRDMGFDGKSLIHPKQIEMANQIFAPSAQEIEHAKEIMLAWEQAQAKGQGVVVVNGRLVENLHFEEAKRLLALNEAIQAQNSALS
ncbi:MAG: CoA ester lyase [Pseudomonadota bacterium]|nr:CoA ester lyase [Pseudomonadota bacterium]